MSSDLGRIQAYLRQQARRGRIGHALTAFTVYLSSRKDGEDASYAIPRRLALPDADADLTELRAFFERHDVNPHVQFLAELYPDLPARLRAAGYHPAGRKPVLLILPHAVQHPPTPPCALLITLSRESSLEEIREGLDTNARGFDEAAAPATEREAEAFRAGLVTSRAFTLRADARPVAAGMLEAIIGGVTELVGITTLVEYRRRGFAAWLTAAMAETAFAHDATLVFLCAVSDEAGRVYQRVGFRPCATFVEYARAAGVPR